jgi:hypothetical protein
VALSVGTRSVQGSLYAGWPGRKLLARSSQVIDAPPQPTDESLPPAVAADPQSSALDAVLCELAASLPLRGSRLVAELAEELILLDVAEGDYGGASDRQLQSIATACVAELLGDAASDQALRWKLQPDLRHLLICAIARRDVEALEQATSRHGLELASLQPGFCAHWNRHADSLAGGSGVFAVTSGAHAIVACAARGVITAVSSGPCEEENATTNLLDERVNRLLASTGLDALDVPAFVVVTAASQTRSFSPRWTVLTEPPEAG